MLEEAQHCATATSSGGATTTAPAVAAPAAAGAAPATITPDAGSYSQIATIISNIGAANDALNTAIAQQNDTSEAAAAADLSTVCQSISGLMRSAIGDALQPETDGMTGVMMGIATSQAMAQSCDQAAATTVQNAVANGSQQVGANLQTYGDLGTTALADAWSNVQTSVAQGAAAVETASSNYVTQVQQTFPGTGTTPGADGDGGDGSDGGDGGGGDGGGGDGGGGSQADGDVAGPARASVLAAATGGTARLGTYGGAANDATVTRGATQLVHAMASFGETGSSTDALNQADAHENTYTLIKHDA